MDELFHLVKKSAIESRCNGAERHPHYSIFVGEGIEIQKRKIFPEHHCGCGSYKHLRRTCPFAQFILFHPPYENHLVIQSGIIIFISHKSKLSDKAKHNSPVNDVLDFRVGRHPKRCESMIIYGTV